MAMISRSFYFLLYFVCRVPLPEHRSCLWQMKVLDNLWNRWACF